MSLFAQTIKPIERRPSMVTPPVTTRGLNADGMEKALKLFGPETLSYWSLNVLHRAEFTPTFGLQFRFIIIRPEQEKDGSIKFHRAMDIANSRGYTAPSFEAGFYLAEWLIEFKGNGFDFEFLIIMHEPVSCGEDPGAGPKIFGVYNNQKARGFFPGPGYSLSGDVAFAYQLPRHFK
jgi:hypothetical protein